MDMIHRILAGNPGRRAELIAAGIFVFVWFAIDVIQFADWALLKFNPPPSARGYVRCTNGYFEFGNIDAGIADHNPGYLIELHPEACEHNR